MKTPIACALLLLTLCLAPPATRAEDETGLWQRVDAVLRRGDEVARELIALAERKDDDARVEAVRLLAVLRSDVGYRWLARNVGLWSNRVSARGPDFGRGWVAAHALVAARWRGADAILQVVAEGKLAAKDREFLADVLVTAAGRDGALAVVDRGLPRLPRPTREQRARLRDFREAVVTVRPGSRLWAPPPPPPPGGPPGGGVPVGPPTTGPR